MVIHGAVALQLPAGHHPYGAPRDVPSTVEIAWLHYAVNGYKRCTHPLHPTDMEFVPADRLILEKMNESRITVSKNYVTKLSEHTTMPLVCDSVDIKFSQDKQSRESENSEDSTETGLTDDERVIREDEFYSAETRVEPGPADLERLDNV